MLQPLARLRKWPPGPKEERSAILNGCECATYIAVCSFLHSNIFFW